MKPADTSQNSTPPAEPADRDSAAVILRLYVARSAPNSVRAQANLSAVLDESSKLGSRPLLEIIDVFSQPKRAITEGVIVTPTLIGLAEGKRLVLMGDLSDRERLVNLLRDLLG